MYTITVPYKNTLPGAAIDTWKNLQLVHALTSQITWSCTCTAHALAHAPAHALAHAHAHAHAQHNDSQKMCTSTMKGKRQYVAMKPSTCITNHLRCVDSSYMCTKYLHALTTSGAMGSLWMTTLRNNGKSTVYQIGELLVSKIINLWYIKHPLC